MFLCIICTKIRCLTFSETMLYSIGRKNFQKYEETTGTDKNMCKCSLLEFIEKTGARYFLEPSSAVQAKNERMWNNFLTEVQFDILKLQKTP